jgi:hypothetical protein
LFKYNKSPNTEKANDEIKRILTRFTGSKLENGVTAKVAAGPTASKIVDIRFFKADIGQ